MADVAQYIFRSGKAHRLNMLMDGPGQEAEERVGPGPEVVPGTVRERSRQAECICLYRNANSLALGREGMDQKDRRWPFQD